MTDPRRLTRADIAALVDGMTDDEAATVAAALAEDARASADEAAIDDLATFVRAAWEHVEPGAPLEWNWHIDTICHALMRQAHGDPDFRRLVICIPPGCMKSLLVSVFGPAWEWLHYPERRILFFANDDELTERDSRRTRSVITSDWYKRLVARVEERRGRAPWVLSHDQNEKHNFENTRKGFRQCMSLTSKVTGKRGDRLVVDDPLDVKAAMLGSPEQVAARLKEANVKIGGALASRVNRPKTSTRTLIMQRIAEDDPAGIAIRSGSWHVINISMEYDPDDPLNHPDDPRTQRGELLFESMFPRDFLADLKRPDVLGVRHYSAQYLQRPTPAEGNLFKRAHVERFYAEDPQRLAATLDEVAISVDCTFGKTKKADLVAMHVWGKKGAKRLLLDRVCRRMNLPETKRELRRLVKKWPTALVKLVELKANGQALIDELAEGDPEATPPVEAMGGLIGFNPDSYGSKEARAQVASVAFEAGNVELPLPQHLPGVQEFIETVCAFPNGAHDDDVDAMSQMFIRWSTSTAAAAKTMTRTKALAQALDRL